MLNLARVCCVFIIALLAALGSGSLGAVALPHELADGEIVRKVQVDIVGNSIRIRYAIGLNNQTMRELIEQISGEIAADDGPTARVQFNAVLGDFVASNLRVDCDDRAIVFDNVTARHIGRDHHRFEVVLAGRIPDVDDASTIRRINVEADVFPEQTGSIRAAFRTRENTILLRSNVAQVAVRQQPVDLGALTGKKRTAASQINASFKIVAKENGN